MAVSTSGGGPGQSRNRLMADINITPMVDVMLVLLIIFMVTAPMLVAKINIDLPRTAAPSFKYPQQPVIVTLAADGLLYVGDAPVDPAHLLHVLAPLKARSGDGVAFVRADRKIAYGDVLDLLGKVGEAGFQRVSLVAKVEAAKPDEAPGRAEGVAP
jgi:biopolymer transport protein TolR